MHQAVLSLSVSRTDVIFAADRQCRKTRDSTVGTVLYYTGPDVKGLQ